MSHKQEIYCDMLWWALPYIRNVQTGSWFRKARDRSCYLEAQLVHNLSISLLEPEFVDHDVWFLNYQARSYVEHCSEKISPVYPKHIEQIAELFGLVPESMRVCLEWSGPNGEHQGRPA